MTEHIAYCRKIKDRFPVIPPITHFDQVSKKKRSLDDLENQPKVPMTQERFLADYKRFVGSTLGERDPRAAYEDRIMKSLINAGHGYRSENVNDHKDVLNRHYRYFCVTGRGVLAQSRILII